MFAHNRQSTPAKGRIVRRAFCVVALAGICSAGAQSGDADLDINQPPHEYRQRTPQDRFTRLKAKLESGEIALDRTDQRAFILSLLRALDIPPSSQLLVFSTTSLQLSLITPANPRAIYFNEDLYVGFIPGGKVEVVGLDPDLGGIYYIFDLPRDERPLRIERSDRCMNCHAGEDTGHVPGLVLKSVVPGPTGGSLTAYRTEESGHGIPFDQRFGGWYVTGEGAATNHWGNLIGRLAAGTLTTQPNRPGDRFSFSKYPMATSDLLPHLVLEHQAGFVNRAVQATYRARTALAAAAGRLSDAQNAELSEQARTLVRYLLFADEAPLPAGGVDGDPAYKTAFLRNRKTAAGDVALKDLDLRTRLFRHRCSYMIYSPVFAGLPVPLKERVQRRLAEALRDDARDEASAHLPLEEKRAIRRILKATLDGYPAGG